MSYGMRLTAAGQKILARGLLGEQILFTKVSIGDGEFDYETESVYELTAMKNWRMDLPLTAKKVQGNGEVYIEAFLSNAEVYEGFACREHALIALDQTTGKEVIYAYRNCGNEYDFIPSNSGSALKNIYMEYIAEIRDAENIEAVLDLSVAYINRQDFDAHINALHPHPNTPNHFGDVTETDKIWATDHDNHLHKISLNNLKALLREDSGEKESALSETDKIARAKQDLGLDANILVIEDFNGGEKVTDDFKLKVTSSAENGALIGVENIAGLKTGALYTISDGYNQESVEILSVRKNLSGFHCKLKKRLDNAYDWNATYLYRSTDSGAEKKELVYAPSEGFAGIEANIGRTLELSTRIENAADFEISGEGFLDAEGYFKLGS